MINEIEQRYEQIYNECQENLYCTPIEYQQSSQRILNAVTILYNQAASIARGENKFGNITLEKVASIFKQILEKLLLLERLPVKEEMVHNILLEYDLEPDELLKLEKWDGNFIEE